MKKVWQDSKGPAGGALLVAHACLVWLELFREISLQQSHVAGPRSIDLYDRTGRMSVRNEAVDCDVL